MTQYTSVHHQLGATLPATHAAHAAQLAVEFGDREVTPVRSPAAQSWVGALGPAVGLEAPGAGLTFSVVGDVLEDQINSREDPVRWRPTY